MSHESETPVPFADSAQTVSVSPAGTHNKGKGVGKRTIKDGEQRPQSKPSSSSSHSRPPQGESTLSTKSGDIGSSQFEQFAELMLKLQETQFQHLSSILTSHLCRAAADSISDTYSAQGPSASRDSTLCESQKKKARVCADTNAKECASPSREQDTFDFLTNISANVDSDGEDGEQEIEENDLSELQEFFLLNDQTGANINDKVAQVINTGMCTHVSRDKIKSVLEKYPTPANTPNVCTPKMNPEIWEVLPSFARMRDVALQRLVTLVVKLIVISAEMFDSFQDRSAPNTINKTLRSMFADQLRLSTALYTELNQKRRDSVKPHLKEEFKQLCRPTQKGSNELLFGDSLSDTVKSIGDSLKLTNVVSPRIYRNAYTTPHGGSKKGQGRMFPPTSRGSFSRGGRQWRGYRNPRRSAPRPQTKPQGSQNLQ